MYTMRRVGFTIVELLIVIVVVAVLAAVSMATYTGLQDRAYSTKAITVVDGITKALDLYQVEVGHYPALPVGSPVCVGELSHYPAVGAYGAGVCDNPHGRTVSQVFNAELKKYIDAIPDGSLPPIEVMGEGVRGVVYQSNPEGSYMRLLYAVRGDQPCPRGEKFGMPFGDAMTICNFTRPEGIAPES